MSLTPLQLNSAAGLLQNQGLVVNPELTVALTTYDNLAVIQPLRATITTAATGNILSSGNLTAVKNLGASNLPSVADSIPSAYSGIPNSNSDPGLTGAVRNAANRDIGNGDISKFCQALAIGQGYAGQTNQFVNSAVNSQTYVGCTFDDMDAMITGDITLVNLATQSFAADLANLGQLIDLSNLGNLGSPLALVQRIQAIGGNVPLLAIYFVNVGIPQEAVVHLNNPTISVTDSVQKLMYTAMTQIQGQDLDQILTLLKITTVGINTMADLLNPLKLFPNSYQSLTVTTSAGPRAIYINSQGTVNSNLRNELPPYVVSNLI
jgi:hypothetical protein